MQHDFMQLQTRYKEVGLQDITAAVAVSEQMAAARELLESLNRKCKEAEKGLGVDGRMKLTNLKGNEFLRHRGNARALKQRIRARLISQKFERTRLERAYRNQVNSK